MTANIDRATRYHHVVIIGGGNAGISLAARLRRYGVNNIAVVEPSERHLYQPLFSHIAGGTAEPEEAVRPQSSVIPRGVTWIKDSVVEVQPLSNTVLLQSGGRVGYGQVVVCPGIQKNWDAVPGLREAMDSPFGVSNYEFEFAAKAWTLFRSLRKGTVVFTMPSGPITCGGASQKPMYLACDYWREQGVLDNIRVVLVVPTPTVFGSDVVDQELNRKIAEYGIELRCSSELTEVDAAARTVLIRDTLTDSSEQLTYDVLHAAPPQSAPDWLKTLSDEADSGGFVAVDPLSLRHVRFPTVWSLGDAAGTRNSKSGAALRKQTMVLAKNLRSVIKGQQPKARYDGYSACPFTVSRSTVVFAEFDDRYRPKPTIPGWKGLAKEKRLTWLIERYGFPRLYWHFILKGRA
ncbi:FAD/NAD(P)-binding oxidoreductase [Arthrobacter sp. H5]|uniref:NAD(P)/FAD-dependent oxidoreductase n=1 Tax=Arthrobacter sp. H5 TaxID=1267973 RepID=UPI00047F1B64|nr:FAD/NAD(P)-binding oxidoreductase [Arthrobacter sp. H5]